jgi:alkylhydroperoxidase family enzyme
MPHISLPQGLPGITGGFAFRPETAKPMRELAEVLLRRANTLTSGEREMIATLVSDRNDCHFCGRVIARPRHIISAATTSSSTQSRSTSRAHRSLRS